MKNRKKYWEKIKRAERDVLTASPPQAAKLVSKIVKWKEQVFEE